MAYTVSMLAKDVFGSKRAHLIKVTADAASGVFDTGLGVVEAFVTGDTSMATASPVLYINTGEDSSSTSNGFIFCSSCATGDAFFLTVYGR